MRNQHQHRVLLGAAVLVCLLLAGALPAAADDLPPAAPSWSDLRGLIPAPDPAWDRALAGDEVAPAAEEEAPSAADEAPAATPDEEEPGDASDDAPASTAAADVEAPASADAEPLDVDGAEVADRPKPARRRLWRLPLSGSFRLDYRGRWDGDESDHDLYQYLVLKVGDECCPGWSYSFHGRLTEDLDGHSDTSGFYVFDSITDTYDSRVNGRVYNLYANWRAPRGTLKQARIGRQWIEGGDLFHMDGLRLDLGDGRGRRGLAVTLFGGLPAHLFEGTPKGDLILGVNVTGRPWTGAEARFDYVYLDDETNYYGNETNHLFTFTLRQRVSQTFAWWGTYQHIDNDPRSLRLAFNTSSPTQDLLLRGSFYSQLTTQNERVTELDPYFVVAQSLEAYWMGDIAVSKGIGERLYLEAGVALRRLWDQADEGVFNREFTRYWGAASLDDWPARNVNVTLTGERWDSLDDAWTVAFDIEHRPSKRVRIQLGTDYSAYRFDLYTTDERQSVRSYYLRMVVRTAERVRLHLKCRVEDDKFDTYVILNSGFEVEL